MARIRPRTEVKAGPSTVIGVSAAPLVGSGAQRAQAASVTGAGTRILTSSGVLASQVSQVAGMQVDEPSPNAARLDAALAGHDIHFTVNYPADPVTTQTVNVSTIGQLQSAVQTSGNRIVVAPGAYNGNLFISGDDIDIVMDNGATLTGIITMRQGLRRLRWTGGNWIDHTDSEQLWRDVADLMFDDIWVETAFYINIANGRGGHRVAWINTTIDMRDVASFSSNKNFNIFGLQGSQGVHQDWILANVKLERTVAGSEIGHAATRIQSCNRIVVVDSAIDVEIGDGNSTGLRFGTESNDAYVANNILMGRNHMEFIDGGYTYVFSNGVFDGNIGYRDFNQVILHAGAANTGVVRNHTLFSAGPSGLPLAGISPLTDGGGNGVTQAWDGVSKPDVSSYGAQR